MYEENAKLAGAGIQASPLVLAQEDAGKALSGLMDSLYSIRAKLAPVLTPEYDNVSSAKNEPMPVTERSPTVYAFQEVSKRADDMRRLVDGLIARLDT